MILLASKSPRRRALLEQIGCAFEVCVSDAEELAGGAPAPQQLVLENARRKACAVARLHGAHPVLGADTAVSLDGCIYGKPKDAAEAERMLRALSGRRHEVATGIAFAWKGEIFEDVVTTSVFFDTLSDAQIASYVRSGEPMDKAGAYAIQGRAAAFIRRIEGSYTNVVGLPLRAVTQLARRAGIALL